MCVRAHRYALAWPTPAGLRGGLALHGDNPLCVKVTPPGEPGPAHVVAGTERDNMIRMGRRGRGGARRPVRGGGRTRRRARSVALREAVRDGWNEAAVARALLSWRFDCVGRRGCEIGSAVSIRHAQRGVSDALR
jgi:hypothetical protein